MILFLKKALIWIKAYWYIPIIIIAAIIVSILFKGKKTIKWDEILDKKVKLHNDEIKALEKIHQEEIKKRESAFRRMEEGRQKIEEEYKKRQLQLDDKKKKEVERILKKTKNDPDAMAEELEKITGYKVFVAE